MYKIGIIGHKFEDLQNFNESIVYNALDLLKYQYGSSLIINLGGERGIEIVAGNYCLDQKIKYHLFLPQSVSIFADENWYDYQKEMLRNQFNNAKSITVCSDTKDKIYENIRDDLLISDSNFMLVFWNRKKHGRTYNMIQNSLTKNKIVINGFENFKLLTSMDLIK